MKRDKVLKIGYDGHSEFITIETDNHGLGQDTGYLQARKFSQSRYIWGLSSGGLCICG